MRRLMIAQIGAATVVVSLVTGASEATADPRPIPDAEYFGVILLPRDEEGVEVPIRNGDTTFGFAKACWKHNFCNIRAIAATIQGSGDKQPPHGNRVVYRAHAVGGGYDLRLRVVADLDLRTGRADPTPDGRFAGVITAYCEGMPRCPDALNEA